MSMPIITSSNTSRQQSITDIIESVALEQTALSHILNSEGEKIQKALEPCATFEFSKENNLKIYDFVYQGVLPYLGLVVDGYQTAIIQLTDSISGSTTMTYCFDSGNIIQYGDHYIQNILQEGIDITDMDANRIRSILFNAFPFITVADLIARSGIADLTQQEAITAAQFAIWKLTNDLSVTITNTKILELYNWYLTLPPTNVIINPAEITLTAQSIVSTGTCSVAFSFKTNGVNEDDTPIPLAYTFSKDIEVEYGAIITETSSAGTTNVEVTNLPQHANFSINITGTQSLPLDAYRYIDTQDLTGLFMQTNNMEARCDYVCIRPCDWDLLKVNKSVIKMVNSITMLELVLHSKLALLL